MKEKTNYGNWVPEKALYMLFGGAIILGAIAAIAQAAFHKPVIAIISGVLGVLILVDIGCGAAALTVRCAKTFPKAQITAMDYWGVNGAMRKINEMS